MGRKEIWQIFEKRGEHRQWEMSFLYLLYEARLNAVSNKNVWRARFETGADLILRCIILKRLRKIFIQVKDLLETGRRRK
jgi:hypothetical protein